MANESPRHRRAIGGGEGCYLCEAVSELHAHRIIHRDISPGNVVVAADGAHLIDLGIARMVVDGATKDTTQLGTRGFASPEQYGFAQTDARSDVYSLGRLLGFMLTGIRPDAEGYAMALADGARVSRDLRTVVERACAFEPSARYQRAEELARALGEAAGVPTAGAAKVAGAVPTTGAAQVAEAARAAGTEGAASGEPASEGTASTTAPEGAAATSVQLEDGSLELAESGWSVSSDGYVNYVLALRNTSSTVAVNLPGTLIAGYAEDGSIAFSQEQYLSVIQPGETFWFAAMAGNATVPASVEFSLIEPEDYRIVQASAEDATRFEVSNTSEVEGSYGTTSFTGEVTTLAEGNDYYSMDMVVVSVILRDGSGAIVSGAQTFVSRPGEGASTSFEVRANNVPDYASYEIYAQVW